MKLGSGCGSGVGGGDGAFGAGAGGGVGSAGAASAAGASGAVAGGSTAGVAGVSVATAGVASGAGAGAGVAAATGGAAGTAGAVAAGAATGTLTPAAGGGGRTGGAGAAELVQFGDVARELGLAGGGFFGLLVLGELVVGRFLALQGALGQGQLVGGGLVRALVLHLGLYLAAGAAAGTADFGRRCGGGELAAEVAKVAALRGHDLARFTLGDGLCAGGVGHMQHGAGFEAVDVAADEGVGVAAHHGDEHLVERDAGRTMGLGQAAGGVAGAGGDGFAVSGGAGGRGGCGGRTAGFGLALTFAFVGGGSGRGHGAGLCRRADGSRCLAQRRRVEQHGVAAHDLAGAPGGVEHQIDEGLVHGPVARQAQHHGAVGTALQLRLDAVDGSGILHALGAEHIGRGDLCAQGFGFGGGDLRQLDLGVQGLAQRRLHGDAAQGQGGGVARVQAAQGEGGGQGRGFPTVHFCHLLQGFGGAIGRRCCHGRVPPPQRRNKK